MADLRGLLEDAGYTNVATYIQSGNVVVDHAQRSPAALEDDIEMRIEVATGLDVAVVARSPKELAAVAAGNPFPKADISKLHVAFLKTKPSAGATGALAAQAFAPEEFAVRGREVYLHLPNGMGRAKAPPVVLKAMKVPATVRNWQTLTKLIELVQAR
jgi:uncharacterized protein (DUF1697 family)